VECSDPRSMALRAMGYRSSEQVWEALSSPKTAKVLARALVKSGWLGEYYLFLKLDSQEALEAIRAGITMRPPPERHKRKRRSRRPPAP
jgi:predicted DNA-binding transcriptional regulator